MTFWYLGTPYSKYPLPSVDAPMWDRLDAAFDIACQARGFLLRHGVAVFSPIIHSHPVAKSCGINPLDHAIWLPVERPILDCASGLIMLKAESWQHSYGMHQERLLFEAAQKPVVWMVPGIFPKELSAMCGAT